MHARLQLTLLVYFVPRTVCGVARVRQIDFNEEVRKESEEVEEAERIAKEADRKPLWEQLAGKRDEKQAKFEAVRASMFGTFVVFLHRLPVRYVRQMLASAIDTCEGSPGRVS